MIVIEALWRNPKLRRRRIKSGTTGSFKTQDVFGQDFKGFEVSVNDRSCTYKPGDAAELRNKQSDISNFINGYGFETGMMKDAAGYHRAISIAMNPKFAQFL